MGTVNPSDRPDTKHLQRHAHSLAFLPFNGCGETWPISPGRKTAQYHPAGLVWQQSPGVLSNLGIALEPWLRGPLRVLYFRSQPSRFKRRRDHFIARMLRTNGNRPSTSAYEVAASVMRSVRPRSRLENTLSPLELKSKISGGPGHNQILSKESFGGPVSMKARRFSSFRR